MEMYPGYLLLNGKPLLVTSQMNYFPLGYRGCLTFLSTLSSCAHIFFVYTICSGRGVFSAACLLKSFFIYLFIYFCFSTHTALSILALFNNLERFALHIVT